MGYKLKDFRKMRDGHNWRLEGTDDILTYPAVFSLNIFSRWRLEPLSELLETEIETMLNGILKSWSFGPEELFLTAELEKVVEWSQKSYRRYYKLIVILVNVTDTTKYQSKYDEKKIKPTDAELYTACQQYFKKELEEILIS